MFLNLRLFEAWGRQEIALYHWPLAAPRIITGDSWDLNEGPM